MNNAVYDLLRSDGSIVINKSLIHSIGLNESILFSELLSRQNYFESRGTLDDQGYFFNTQYDLQAGTGLGEKAQRTAISNLKRLRLIHCKLKGMPAKRYFKIIADDDLLFELLKDGKEKLKNLENSAVTSQGGNMKRQGKELVTPKGSANKPKNNTKNNTNLCLQHLSDAELKGKNFDEVFALYTFKRFKKPLRRATYKYSLESLQGLEPIELVEVFDKNIKTYDQCNYDYLNSLDERIRCTG